MPREIFTCEKCDTKQAVPGGKNRQSITCINCGHKYALVRTQDEAGNDVKAPVEFFNQTNE